jgi:hypothetical protein
MPPAVLLALTLVEEAIKLEPAVETELRKIFSNPTITPADWQAARAKRDAASFESLAPDAPVSK